MKAYMKHAKEPSASILRAVLADPVNFIGIGCGSYLKLTKILFFKITVQKAITILFKVFKIIKLKIMLV
jgi:hypothetical protein